MVSLSIPIRRIYAPYVKRLMIGTIERITMRKPNGIVLHHSGTDTGNAESFKRYHISLGWNTIGYHYVILKNGTIEIGRSISQRGSHCRGNNGTVGIVLVGKLDNQPPTPEQYIALIRLLSHLCFAFNFNPNGTYKHGGNNKPVLGAHLDFCNTTCPGATFYNMLDKIRIDVSSKLKEDSSFENLMGGV